MFEEIEQYFSPSVLKIEKVFPFHINYLVNPDKDIAFVLINKCASSTLKHTLPKYGFFIVDHIPNVSNFYAIIRDPVSRWISGLNEFIFAYGIKDFEKIERHLESSKFIFDHHAFPQHLNLDKVQNITLIKFEDDLLESLKDVCNDDIVLVNKNMSWEKKEKDCRDMCKKWFEKYSRNNENFMNLYNNDFLLHEKAGL